MTGRIVYADARTIVTRSEVRTTVFNSDRQVHCDNSPAIRHDNGTDTYYHNGKKHRIDGPAIICSNGDKMWYNNGRKHRVGAPAVCMTGGFEEWRINDELHRTDGPAMAKGNYAIGWYVKGMRCNNKFEFQRRAGISMEELALIILKYGPIP